LIADEPDVEHGQDHTGLSAWDNPENDPL